MINTTIISLCPSVLWLMNPKGYLWRKYLWKWLFWTDGMVSVSYNEMSLVLLLLRSHHNGWQFRLSCDHSFYLPLQFMISSLLLTFLHFSQWMAIILNADVSSPRHVVVGKQIKTNLRVGVNSTRDMQRQTRFNGHFGFMEPLMLSLFCYSSK